MRGFFIQIYKHLSFHTNYIFLSKKVIILQAYDVVLKSELALHLKAIFENKKYKMFHKIPNSIKLSINLKTNKNKPKMSIFIRRQRCLLTFTAKNSSKVSTLFIIIIQYLSITALIYKFCRRSLFAARLGIYSHCICTRKTNWRFKLYGF